MRTVLALSVAIIVLFLSVFSTYSQAAPQDNKIEINKKQAVELAKNIYTVRILKSDGHVVDVHVNKKTGEVKKD